MSLKDKCEIWETEVINLRSTKIEQESKIIYLTEKLKSLQLDNEQKVKSYHMIEGKMLKAQKTIEENNLRIKDQD